MKKIMLLVFCLHHLLTLFSQVSLQPAIPPVGMIQKDQLWHLLVINSSPTEINARIDVVVRDRMDGNEVLAGTSSTFNLPVGAVQLTANSIGLIQYNFFNADWNTSLSGFLPVGNYIVCYAVLTGESNDQLVASECVQFDIEPVSPPMLTFPPDRSELTEDPKQFSWVPPAPLELFSALKYDIVIAAIEDGQQPDEALQNNTPIIYESGLSYNSYQRSNAFLTLEPGKWYAWQVIARNRSQYASKSETWIFRYGYPVPGKTVKATPYVMLQKDNPVQAIAPDGYLKFTYNNRLNDTVAIVTISETGKKETSEPEPHFSIKLRRGENQVMYYLPQLIKVSKEKTYQAVFKNSAGENWIMLFQVKYFKD